MAQVNINDVPIEQLFVYAQSFNLDATPGVTSDADLRAMVRAAIGGLDTIEIDLGEPEETRSVAQQISSNRDLSHYSNDPKVIINIASDDMNGGSRPFPIGVNGVPIWVRRDEDVAIPYRFYLALKNAVEKDFEVYTDPVTGLLKERQFERQAHRFTVVSMPSKQEIDAFHERTRHIKNGSLRQAA